MGCSQRVCTAHAPGVNLSSLGGEGGALALMLVGMPPRIYSFVTPSERGGESEVNH